MSKIRRENCRRKAVKRGGDCEIGAARCGRRGGYGEGLHAPERANAAPRGALHAAPPRCTLLAVPTSRYPPRGILLAAPPRLALLAVHTSGHRSRRILLASTHLSHRRSPGSLRARHWTRRGRLDAHHDRILRGLKVSAPGLQAGGRDPGRVRERYRRAHREQRRRVRGHVRRRAGLLEEGDGASPVVGGDPGGAAQGPMTGPRSGTS